MIPPATRGALLDALVNFDRELRGAPEWIEWEQNGTHKYAIEHEGRLYPVKQIIALATGIERNTFGGGQEANTFITKQGFLVVPLSLTSTAPQSIPQSAQGGPAASAPFVVVARANGSLAIGAELDGGRYRIIRPIKSGGFGAVYLAKNQRLSGATCAIKELRVSPSATLRDHAESEAWFAREARHLMELRHPMISRI